MLNIVLFGRKKLSPGPGQRPNLVRFAPLLLAVGLALLQCADYDARIREWIAREKPALATLLAAIPGLAVCPGAVNFLLCRIQSDRPTSVELRAACLERGLLIRDASNFEGLDGHHFRLAVRTETENRCMAKIIREALAGYK